MLRSTVFVMHENMQDFFRLLCSQRFRLGRHPLALTTARSFHLSGLAPLKCALSFALENPQHTNSKCSLLYRNSPVFLRFQRSASGTSSLGSFSITVGNFAFWNNKRRMEWKKNLQNCNFEWGRALELYLPTHGLLTLIVVGICSRIVDSHWLRYQIVCNWRLFIEIVTFENSTLSAT